MPAADQCTVCPYPRRQEIEDAWLSGKPVRAIERQERAIDPKAPGRKSITAHIKGCVQARLATAEVERAKAHVTMVQSVAVAATERLEAVKPLAAFSDRIEALLVPIEKLLRAADRWLTDPDDSSEYEIGPRAYEIEVTYEEVDDEGKPKRRKATLAELLAKVGGRFDVVSAEAKIADPRKLLLEASSEARESLSLIAKIIGVLKPDPTATTNVQVNVFTSTLYMDLEALVFEVIGDDEARRRRYALGLRELRERSEKT